MKIFNRYGMRDDNTKNHDTWYHCKKVIEWCFEESSGLFFLSLQAEKYGSSSPFPLLSVILRNVVAYLGMDISHYLG